MNKFKFSIVVPIYNVEKYIEETIESIIKQTIGFEENIQLVLVNDGSTDNSEDICLKYKEKYPENIIYAKKENGGVSSARNKGIEYITGKYVNFLDGDDKWSLNALEIMYNFLEQNYDNIDFAVGRKRIFEAKDGFHILDYKFQETKVVDILEDYNFVQMDVTSVFFKSKIAKEHRFNENIQYAEDAEYVNKILLKSHKFGVVREAVHLYRKRIAENSALQTAKKSKSWFINTIEYFHNQIIEDSKSIYGKVIPYVQYTLMYDIQWRLKNTNFDTLNEKEKNQYIRSIINLLKIIDDHIIIEQKNINSKLKLYTLSLKYDRDIINNLEFIDGIFYLNNLEVYKIKDNKKLLKIEKVDIENNILKINGKTRFAIPISTYEIFYNTNLKKKTKIILQEENKDIIIFKGEKFKNYYFSIEIPLININRINFIFKYKYIAEQKLAIGLGENIELNESNLFSIKNKKYEVIYNKKYIEIHKKSMKNKIKKILSRI